MKKPIILGIIAAFFTVIFVYATTTLSPWDKDKFSEFSVQYDIKSQDQLLVNFDSIVNSGLVLKLLHTRNVLIWAVLFGLALVLGFASVHSFIDKLFFRKFFEEPSLVKAFRRGIFIFLAFLGVVFLRLIGGLYWYNAAAIIALFIALELVIRNTQLHRTKVISRQIKD
ncbi:MAG TPA: hypothetical protein VJC17_00015 [Candidatus Dojkabacteria bacterium]|nr:hypothetical protein [Candidatus Dojkabacteria bacterium]